MSRGAGANRANLVGKVARTVYEWFERVVVVALLATLMVVIGWSTTIFIGELGSQLSGVWTGRIDHADTGDLFERMELLREVFGAFLLLLIGLELMKTVAMYLERNVLHWDVVFSVALIAVARHTLEVDLDQTSPLSMIGIGVVIITLATGYFVLSRSSGEGHLHGADRERR